jgi:hypothetical protein
MKFSSLFVRSVALVTCFNLIGCASTTVIRSEPAGANLYIDGSKVGRTPYVLSDTKIVGSSTNIRIEAEGHESFQTVIRRDEELHVGALIGGLFLLVPFLWIMGYRGERTYELEQKKDPNEAPLPPSLVSPN